MDRRYGLFLFMAAEIIAGSIVELNADVSIVTREGLDTLCALLLVVHYLTPCIDRRYVVDYDCQRL